MFDKILVAYDGSAAAGNAFDLALDLALKYSAELKVLAVAQPPEFSDEVETEAAVEHARQHYFRQLKPLRNRVTAAMLKCQFEVGVGPPAERILLTAERWDARLIVMGHRGTGLLGRWLVGSVAKQVMHHAPCTVMIAR